ncbi:hypothetical protein UFOVP703_46 [uncultured Caudovirales phage]|uniref:Uncharacterized protein n=1 Tax=uncultured Caudovirales phage TaxID=2100421 RepID=A0A6J5NMM5_9CAUD|nr:hypothetical protein UFOVP703_46 [uncultured Caudovirales phage]
MSTFRGLKFASPRPFNNDGRAVFINDQAPIGVNPSIGNTAWFFLPKGTEVSYLRFFATDMDSAAGMQAEFGFAPLPGGTVVANNAYFGAAQAFGQTAGGPDLSFVPITFEEDVAIQVRFTAAATGFTAGTVHCVLGGNSVGVR